MMLPPGRVIGINPDMAGSLPAWVQQGNERRRMKKSVRDRPRCTAASYRPIGGESRRRSRVVGSNCWRLWLRVSCNHAVAYAILGIISMRGAYEGDAESALCERRICVSEVSAIIRARKVDRRMAGSLPQVRLSRNVDGSLC